LLRRAALALPRSSAETETTEVIMMNRMKELRDNARQAFCRNQSSFGTTTGSFVSAIKWIAIGAGTMYFLDPISGARRRAYIGQKLTRFSNEIAAAWCNWSTDTANRVGGYAHEAKARMTEGEVPDEILAERVRSKMGRAVKHPAALCVSARNGIVTLSGPILS